MMLILNMCVTMADNRKPRREVIAQPPGHAHGHEHEMFHDVPDNQPYRYIIPTNPKGAKEYEYWQQNY